MKNTAAFRTAGLVAGTALASLTLAGCATSVAKPASVSAAQAQTALDKGKVDKAVTLAEAAVLAQPRDGATRALLGAAYIKAGRFASAATALGDAVELGDTSSRTVLGYALTLAALDRYADAQGVLAEHQNAIDTVDYGLALALAGSPQQGAEILANALRYGGDNPKLRQNLAYAFALKGDWRAARLVAAQDLSADKLDERLGEWAQLAMPGMATQRVARLLGVTARADSGQPVSLALVNFKTNEQLAQEAAPATALAQLAEAPAAELPAAPAPAQPANEAPALATAPSDVPAAPRIVLPRPAAPVVAVRPAAPRAAAAPRSSTARAFDAAFVRRAGGYSVQLGSFSSPALANDAWAQFQKRHPQLRGTQRIVTQAEVAGKTYYRVAAAGFAKGNASAFCATVRKGGGGCLAYVSAKPRPMGAVRGAQVAAR